MKKYLFTFLMLLYSTNSIAGDLIIYNYCDKCSSIRVIVTVPASQFGPSYDVQEVLGDYGDSVFIDSPREGNYRLLGSCLSGADYYWDFTFYHNGQIFQTDNISLTCDTGGCVLEKIYEEDSEEVELLRRFRDSILSKTQEGQEIIRLYYELSPVIVKAMEEDEEFKENVKGMIDGVLSFIYGVSE